LVLHFRFDGQLIWFDDGKPRGHVDVTFQMDHGTLAFVDPRHLGRVEWTPSPASLAALGALGIEPLSPQFTPDSLRAMLQASRQPLKLFLLDQSRIAGIGNIYSNEAMWHARIDPRRPSNDLSPQDARRLHKSIVGVLRRALECCLHPAPDFRDPNWWFQGLEATLRTYGREGEICRRCGHAIERMPQGGRSTYWCPGCQE
jgi:formamidopyrimidine-DNA glycosylase